MIREDFADRYVNPYTDFGFKKLFGTEMNKDLLKSFVNSLLRGKEEIKDLRYLNAEHLGTSEADRRAVFDVYCENEKGEKILVEMQRGEQQFFKDRSLYYATFPIREQGHKGEWDYRLKAVYVIGILNFTFDDKDGDYYHHEVQLTDNRTKEVFYDKLTFIYLEMPKFNKREDELDGMFEKWLFVLRNLSRLMDRPKALQERIFTKLFRAAEIAKFTKEEYDAYEESLKVYRDWKNTIDTAEYKARKKGLEEGRAKGLEEGLAKGRVEGVEEGMQQKAVEVARQLKQKGVPVSVIAECRARLGGEHVAGAIEDLNMIRRRANAKLYDASEYGGDLRYAIFKEREKELLMEGHRYYDVIRNGYVRTELDEGFRNASDQDFIEGCFFNTIGNGAFDGNTLMRQNTYWLRYM